jgi:hypothetical protein
MKALKERLLADAATKDVHHVYQFDGFALSPGEGDDGLMRPDQDGDVLNSGRSAELRRSGADLAVRVHIHEGTDRARAIRLLKKITAWLESDPTMLRPEHYSHGFDASEPEDAGTPAASGSIEDVAALRQLADDFKAADAAHRQSQQHYNVARGNLIGAVADLLKARGLGDVVQFKLALSEEDDIPF